MALWLNYLAENVTAKQHRIRLIHRLSMKRGHFVLIGLERMKIMRIHRDGTITVKRPKSATEHHVLDFAVHGNLKSFL